MDGGADITDASIASYYQDIIYVCAFVQVLSIVTDKAFWAFWLLPLVLAFIVYNSLIKPIMQQYQAPPKVNAFYTRPVVQSYFRLSQYIPCQIYRDI